MRAVLLALALIGCAPKPADDPLRTKLMVLTPGRSAVLVDYPTSSRCATAALSLERQAATDKSELKAYCIPS